VKLFLALLLLAAPVCLASEADLGAPVPDGSRKVAELRYRSSTDWDNTLKWYQRHTNLSRPKMIINQPGIKAVHLFNPSGKKRWEGLNVYEANGEVRISIVPVEKNGKKSGKK